ncbi:hypothetical protein Ahy_A01g002869 [Arachis hypogaea]|uniref:Uncharacterized protein n=1 Tax=Arachis hypogaea TaxID=3818 RepID=A0A445ERX6_ARAHY|nr:hypothetical protein Ahy_A01g002869 [Arachis hypogaea]
MASGGVSHIWRQSILLRLRLLRCSRHSLRRRWPHYFKECYIQGSIDFIFGNGRSTYKVYELLVLT